MSRQPADPGLSMVERIARAIAEADGADFDLRPDRFRRMAMAALGPMQKPTEAMVDAAHEAASFDAHWAINRRQDFRKAVKAMVVQAQKEHTETAERLAPSAASPPPRHRSRG